MQWTGMQRRPPQKTDMQRADMQRAALQRAAASGHSAPPSSGATGPGPWPQRPSLQLGSSRHSRTPRRPSCSGPAKPWQACLQGGRSSAACAELGPPCPMQGRPWRRPRPRRLAAAIAASPGRRGGARPLAARPCAAAHEGVQGELCPLTVHLQRDVQRRTLPQRAVLSHCGGDSSDACPSRGARSALLQLLRSLQPMQWDWWAGWHPHAG